MGVGKSLHVVCGAVQWSGVTCWPRDLGGLIGVLVDSVTGQVAEEFILKSSRPLSRCLAEVGVEVNEVTDDGVGEA